MMGDVVASRDVQDLDGDGSSGFPTLLPPSSHPRSMLQRKRTGSLGSSNHPRTTSSVSFLDPVAASAQHRSGSAPPEKRDASSNGMQQQQNDAIPPGNNVGERLAPHRETRTGTITSSEPGPAGTSTNAIPSTNAPQVEPLLLDCLRVHKDRILLLRSDLEMERFVNDPLRTRLSIAPPTFPPNLNSYQRLLIHRLADMWNVTRELEPALSPQLAAQQQSGHQQSGQGGTQAQTTMRGSEISGVIVLVKTERTRHPPIRLASLVPSVASEPGGMQAFNMIQQPQPGPSSMPMLVTSTAALSMASGPAPPVTMPSGNLQPSRDLLPGAGPSPFYAESPSSSTSAVTSPSSTNIPGPIRIMSRSTNASGSSQSPVSRTGSAANTAMTFEEREAAYQEARMRIFNQSNEAPPPPNGQLQMPYATNLFNPVEHAARQQQHAMVLPDMPGNNTLRPSAPAFVYQQLPQYPQPPPPQQQYAFYAVPVQSQSFVQGAPPIEVTMPSPAVSYAQQVAYPSYSPTPSVAENNAYPVASTSSVLPSSRPVSVRSHSHSSHSSISTTTSTSSIRTASTSSARRSNVGIGPAGLDLRPIRQTTSKSHPIGRQARPPLPATVGSARSAASVTSGNSRYSHSSSSASTSTSTSLTGSAASAGGNSLGASSSSKGKGKEMGVLAEAHPSLPQRPTWITSKKPGGVDGEEEQEELAAGTIAGAGDIDMQPLTAASTISNTQAESLGASTGSQGASPTASLDGTPGSRPEELPAALTPPAAPSSAASDAGSSIAPSESASQVQSKPKKSAQTQKIVEYPPLRYDPAKGWTTLDGGASVASPVLSSGHAVSGQQATLATGKPTRPPSSQNQRKQQQQQQQHHQQQPYFQPSPRLQHQQQPYLQQQPQGYPMQMQYAHMQPAQLPPGAQQQQYYYAQPYMQQPGPPMGDLPPQQQMQQPPLQYGGGYHYISVPVQYGPQDQPQYYQQPPLQPQQFQYASQPMQQVPMPVPMQQYSMGGMTAADIIASGEMLYSHDVPRPVPRSGATLFDPNASSRVGSS